MSVVILKLGLLISLLHSGSAIRCYICQSRSNPACQDPIKEYELQKTECTPEVLYSSSKELNKALDGLAGMGAHLGVDVMVGPPTYAHTPMSCQKISFNVGQERVVVRGCQAAGWTNEPDKACRMLEHQAERVSNAYINYCDTCGDKDGCNTATVPLPALLLLLLPALLLLLTLH